VQDHQHRRAATGKLTRRLQDSVLMQRIEHEVGSSSNKTCPASPGHSCASTRAVT
jgi:hypothetical protein